MSKTRDLSEFQAEVDALNLTFGAALGAYVGIVLATEKVSDAEVWTLVILLALLASFLVMVRGIARSIHGHDYVGLKFPYNLTFAAATGVVIEVTALGLPDGASKFNIMFRGWSLTLAIALLVSFLRERHGRA